MIWQEVRNDRFRGMGVHCYRYKRTPLWVATGHSSAANRIRPIDNGLDLDEVQLGGRFAATYASAMTSAASPDLNLVPCRNASAWCRAQRIEENLRRALAPTSFRPFVTSGLGVDVCAPRAK